MNFSKSTKAVSALSYGSGSADRTGPTIDTLGFDGCAFVVHFAAVDNSLTESLKVEGSHDGQSWEPLSGVSQTVAGTDDNKLRMLDVYQPNHRYLHLLVDKDTSNTTAESAVAYLYDPREEPVTQSDEVVAATFHQSPAAA
jgi:hypothetical protein